MKRIPFIFAAIMLLGVTAALHAQVTIGSDKVPETFSVLELVSNNTRGLRLPQLTTVERNAMQATAEFQAEKTGAAMGTQIFNTTVKCVQTWNGTMWLSPCDEACEDCSETASITTFVNVMYDFQHQTLEAYNVPNASEHQWQVRTASEAGFKNIAGANSPFYTIPENYINSYSSDTLYFRCLMNTAAGARVKTPEFEMLFIRTSTAGYGTENGVKYLTIEKGAGGLVKGGTIKIALLNLGQNEGNNAGDLGDMYQWGRIPDGHEKVVWSKPAAGTSRINQITPFSGGGNATSAVIAKTAVTTYTPPGQIDDANAVDKYIVTSDPTEDWSGGTAVATARWGNGDAYNYANRNSDILLTEWTYPENNPCPGGWGVPSRWNWWDMYRGNGTDITVIETNYTGTANTWQWRASTSPANNAYGGAIITNKDGEKAFLPATGYRHVGYSGTLISQGESAVYWSSTNSMNASYDLFLANGRVNANSTYSRASAIPVRCVKEVPAP